MGHSSINVSLTYLRIRNTELNEEDMPMISLPQLQATFLFDYFLVSINSLE